MFSEPVHSPGGFPATGACQWTCAAALELALQLTSPAPWLPVPSPGVSPLLTARRPCLWGGPPTPRTSRQTRQVSRVALQASRLQSREAEPQPSAFTVLTVCHLQTPAGSPTSERECCPERRASSSHSWGFKCYEAMGLGEGCGILSPSHFLVTSKHLESRTLLISVGLKLEKNIHTFSKARRKCINVLLIPSIPAQLQLVSGSMWSVRQVDRQTDTYSCKTQSRVMCDSVFPACLTLILLVCVSTAPCLRKR